MSRGKEDGKIAADRFAYLPAVACYGRVLELAVAAGDEVQAAGIRERLEPYRR